MQTRSSFTCTLTLRTQRLPVPWLCQWWASSSSEVVLVSIQAGRSNLCETVGVFSWLCMQNCVLIGKQGWRHTRQGRSLPNYGAQSWCTELLHPELPGTSRCKCVQVKEVGVATGTASMSQYVKNTCCHIHQMWQDLIFVHKSGRWQDQLFRLGSYRCKEGRWSFSFLAQGWVLVGVSGK